LAPPVSSRRLVATLSCVLALTASEAARAQGEPYKQHMDNGVRLYTDRNYAAAVVEFQAAYEARPSANPLVNIALCDKEMFHYPAAIAALITALARHGDAMDPADKAAAEQAIKEMHALLGTVTVTVQPPGATVLVDGEAVKIGEPIPLGPGTHKVTARAEGYASAEQTVRIASGGAEAVSMELTAEKGPVRIEAPDPRMTISVDNVPMGNGVWSGMLAPGQHLVKMYGSDGQAPYGMTIVVNAGVPLDVRQGVGGVPLPLVKKEEPPRRGAYVLGLGSLLFAAVHPPLFTLLGGARVDYGAAYGLRGGFQVNNTAGFDLTYEHSSIATYTNDSSSSYRIVADRIAVGLRLISPGRLARFVGNFGGGFVVDAMTFDLTSPLYAACSANVHTPCPLHGTIYGPDAFALLEAGIEVDIDHVLLDFLGEGQFQSTGNLTGPALAPMQTSIFAGKPLFNYGPAIRIGYRFW